MEPVVNIRVTKAKGPSGAVPKCRVRGKNREDVFGPAIIQDLWILDFVRDSGPIEFSMNNRTAQDDALRPEEVIVLQDRRHNVCSETMSDDRNLLVIIVEFNRPEFLFDFANRAGSCEDWAKKPEDVEPLVPQCFDDHPSLRNQDFLDTLSPTGIGANSVDENDDLIVFGHGRVFTPRPAETAQAK